MVPRLARLAVLVLLLALSALPARADDYASLIASLGSDSFADKEKAIAGLGSLGDPRAVPVLQALGDDRLRTGPNGQVLIVTTAADGSTVLNDAITGQPAAGVAMSDTSRVIVNNRLRGGIEEALGGLTLFSPNRDIRLAAAGDALKHPSAESVTRLNKAIANEADPEVRAAMQKSLYAAQLASGSKEEQLAAVAALAGYTDPQIKSLLDELAATPNLDPELKKAADAAIAAIDRRLRLVGVVANLFQGLSLGSILLLAAIGLAITFGVMGVINMAHGEMIMVGAYVAYVVQQFFRAYLPPGVIDGYLIVAVPVAFLFAGLLGVILERCLIRFLYGRPLETLLTTFGVSLILIQATRMLFGAQNVQVINPAWMSGGVTVLPNLILPYNRLAILAFSLIVVGIAWAVLTKTRLGLFVRAVTQNRRMAACVGVKTARVDTYAFAFGAGIAGLGGCALSQIGNVGPDLGQSYIIDSFMAVVLGGVGQLAGTVIGGFGLGLVSKAIEPFWGAVLAKIAVLVLIVLFIQKRPQGMFALKGRSAEA